MDDTKVLETMDKQLNETVDMTEELYELKGRINLVYLDVLDKYMNTKAVVEFNFLEFLKGQTKNIDTREKFEILMANIISDMEKIEPKTTVLKWELKLAKRVYNDVALAKGKLFQFQNEKVKVKYDGQDVEFNPITFVEKGDLPS